jgi:hypothetical protein
MVYARLAVRFDPPFPVPLFFFLLAGYQFALLFCRLAQLLTLSSII